jgi:hypothetical protein
MSQRLDLQSYQRFLLVKGYGARATKPTRREMSRARLQRDLYRGRPRKPNATATEVNRFSSYDGEDYVAFSNGRIEKLNTKSNRIATRLATDIKA